LIPAVAAANTPLGELWVLGAPVFLAWEGLLWIFAAITLIEGSVLSLVLRISLMKGLGIALIANLVSSLVGAALYFAKCVAIVPIFILVALLDAKRGRTWLTMAPLTIPVIFLALFAFSATWVAYASQAFGSFDIQTRLLALIPAFLMSFLIELVVHFYLDKNSHPGKLCLAWGIANGVSYPFLAMIFLLNPAPDFMSPGANSWGAISDIRLAIKRGELDRALDHSDTLRAISREEPLIYDSTLETPLKLARAVKNAGRHRQALMILAEFPPPEESDLQSTVNSLREEILVKLRASHPGPITPESPQ
jgi:hypothetical protein